METLYAIKKTIIVSIILTLIAVSAHAQTLMTGTVMNDDGVKMVGAFINIEGTNIVTLTDLDGKFTLSVPDSCANRQVTISYAGYLLETIDVSDGFHSVVLRNREKQRINEITVSTQKRSQRIVEVPIALTVIDSTKIRQNAIRDVEDMSHFAPGFSIAIPSLQISMYSIRGVTSDEPVSYGQSRISVFMDGISISRMQTAYLEQYDLERVEIAKGPQGTLFGRGAEIGAVHFIRKKPADEFSADIAVSYGNYNQRKVSGILNTPAGSVISNRLVAQYNAHDGIIKNNAGGKLNGKNTIALRNSTAFHLGSDTDLNLVFDFQKDDTPGFSYQNKTQYDINGNETTTDKSPFTTADLTFGDDDLYLKRKTGGFLMQFDSKLSEHLQLSSTSGIRAYDAEESFDGDGTVLPVLNGMEGAKGMQASQELRLNWTSKNKKVNVVVGGTYFYENGEQYYKFSGNLHYIYPIAIGKGMRSTLEVLPDSIIAGLQRNINMWADAQKEIQKEKFKDFPTVANQIEHSIDSMTVILKDMLAKGVKEQVTPLYDKWFDVMYWDRTPNFAKDTEEAIRSVLLKSINELIETNNFAKIVVAQFGGSAENILSTFDLSRGLTRIESLSDIELTDSHYEEELDYNINNEASVFTEFNWNFAPKLYMTLGIRGVYETTKTGYRSSSLEAPILKHVIYASTNGQKQWTDKTNYKSWVGRAVLNYMIDSTHNVYISASKGRRPGMVYFDFLRPDSIIHNLAPEKIYNYEIGFKGSSKYGHLVYDATFYYYDWHHFQTVIAGGAASSDGTLNYLYDDNGIAYGMGAELSGTYIFNTNMSIFTDITYSDGTFADKDMNGKIQNNSGNQFAMMPHWMFDIGLNWRHQLNNGKILYFNPSIYTQSKLYFDDSNKPEYSQGSYILANANVGIQWSKGRITHDLGICGQNITNSKYIVDVSKVGETIGMPTYVPGSTAMVYLTYRLHIQ